MEYLKSLFYNSRKKNDEKSRSFGTSNFCFFQIVFNAFVMIEKSQFCTKRKKGGGGGVEMKTINFPRILLFFFEKWPSFCYIISERSLKKRQEFLFGKYRKFRLFKIWKMFKKSKNIEYFGIFVDNLKKYQKNRFRSDAHFSF